MPNYPYDELDIKFDRPFVSGLNKNFDDVEQDINGVVGPVQALLDGNFDSAALVTEFEARAQAKLEEIQPDIFGFQTETRALIEQNDLKKLNRNENESITKAMLSQELKEEIIDGEFNFILNTSEIENGAVTPLKIASEGFSDNIFDKDSATLGSYYNGSLGGMPTLITSANWYGNHTPISVSPGDVIKFNKAYMNGYYRGVDAAGVIRQTVSGAVDPAGFVQVTVAAGVVGFYTAVYKTDINDFMIILNADMPSDYMPFKLKKSLKWLAHEPKSIEVAALTDAAVNELKSQVSQWTGRSFISNGTSISWQDGKVYAGTSNVARGYQTIMREKLGFSSYVNAGASGKAMADGTTNGSGIVTTGLEQDYAPHSLATIEAGTNDFKLNVPIGVLKAPGSTDFDRTTFLGAYQTLIEFILSQKPIIRIVLLTPLQRDNGGYNGWNYVNAAGHTLNDYRKAIFELETVYGTPICDLYATSGFNKLTLALFTKDGLHPDDVGYARMGGTISSFVATVNV